jgi:hypothetical protein
VPACATAKRFRHIFAAPVRRHGARRGHIDEAYIRSACPIVIGTHFSAMEEPRSASQAAGRKVVFDVIRPLLGPCRPRRRQCVHPFRAVTRRLAAVVAKCDLVVRTEEG